MSEKIRVCLAGLGNMGSVVKKLIDAAEDMEIVCVVDPNVKGDGILKSFSDIRKDMLDNIDVYVNFTHPTIVVESIKEVAAAGKDCVIGTTGWYDKLEEVKKIADDSGRIVLYAPNFSLLVNVQRKLAAEAAKMLAPKGYSVAIVEEHHTGKKDAPSGTAAIIADDIMKVTDLNKKIFRQEGISPKQLNELDMASVRVGGSPGEHDVRIVGPGGKLNISTIMFSRDDFGMGALEGIRWVYNARKRKTEPGLYNFFDHVLGFKIQ